MGERRILTLWSFVGEDNRGSEILRASQTVVRSEEVHSKVITYVGKLHHKNADSNPTAERSQEGGLGKYRKM